MNVSIKHPHPLRFQLRVLAGKLEKGAITQDERRGLIKLLRLLAEGKTLDTIFGVIKAAHRPKSRRIEQRLYDMEVMRLAKKHGGSGFTKTKAIQEVARIHNVSVATVETDCKSNSAKTIRAAVIASHYNPLELSSYEYKGG